MNNNDFLFGVELIIFVEKNKDLLKIEGCEFLFGSHRMDYENDISEFEICYVPKVRQRTKTITMSIGEFVDAHNKTFNIEA